MLTEDVANGSHQFDVPQTTIDNEIQTFLNDLKKDDPDFNFQTEFDPEVHILHKDSDFEKTRILTLDDLNISKTHVTPISPIAVTDPFPLFTPDAIKIMKWESFQAEVVKKYGRIPLLAKGTTATDLQICGFAKDYAPFTFKAWTHPRVMEILSKYAGIELKVMFDFEVAHINASLIPKESKDIEISEAKGGENIHRENIDDAPAVYSWHYDSNSFVCVLILSANDRMIGGETGLRQGDESIVTIKDPKVGYASILQGRVIKHIANKPISNDERISSVTGYIPADPEVYDSTCLTSLKPSVLPRSIHDEYYPEWLDYRFKRIEERLKLHRESLIAGVKEGKKFDQWKSINFSKDIETYLHDSWKEFEVVCDDEYPPKLFTVPYSDL